MGAYYTFISSLNYLDFSGEAPFSPEEFLERAAVWLPEKELAALEDGLAKGAPKIASTYERWEKSFRSAVATLRAAKLSLDFQPNWLECDFLDGETRQAIQELYKAGDPLKLERGLDAIRFAKLDELSVGHFFDFTIVFCYYRKLKLLWRWQTLNPEAGAAVVKSCSLPPAEN